MARERFKEKIEELLGPGAYSMVHNNYAVLAEETPDAGQSQTNKSFSDKWDRCDKDPGKEGLYKMQKSWYLRLYGFDSETALSLFLKGKKIIFDAGCGLGCKTAWFAELAPDSLVIGMDFSEAALQAARIYGHLPNLFFIKGDIANTGFPDNSIDYVNCDQVIMHTQNPDRTFTELTRMVSKNNGELACYFYAKKALPRELLDDHFRAKCAAMSNRELWEMSEQLAELGKRLSGLKISFNAPDIPAMGIKGGQYDIQRFLYWNFIKCFWDEELGRETSAVINYDWYGPSNARRYSKEEVTGLIRDNGLSIIYFHQEEACYSGRFAR